MLVTFQIKWLGIGTRASRSKHSARNLPLRYGTLRYTSMVHCCAQGEPQLKSPGSRSLIDLLHLDSHMRYYTLRYGTLRFRLYTSCHPCPFRRQGLGLLQDGLYGRVLKIGRVAVLT